MSQSINLMEIQIKFTIIVTKTLSKYSISLIKSIGSELKKIRYISINLLNQKYNEIKIWSRSI
jgi:hypothetical protein